MSPAPLTEEQKRNRALLRVALRAAIAQASDEQLEDGRPRALAAQLASTDVDRAQIRNLENLAYTTDKVSDITDLLKKLIGRDARNRRWAKDRVGNDVISALEALRLPADKIAEEAREHYGEAADADLPRRIHLELCREFVKHLTAEFLYRKPEGGHERG